MTFTPQVYAEIREGARRSAAVIVPLLIQTVLPYRVLDVGCGEGWFAREFARHGISVTAVAAVRPLTNVVAVIGEFAVARLFAADAFDLVWVDGVHDFDNVVADLEIAGRFTCPTVVHDWGRYEVEAAAVSLGLTGRVIVDSLAMIERPTSL